MEGSTAAGSVLEAQYCLPVRQPAPVAGTLPPAHSVPDGHPVVGLGGVTAEPQWYPALLSRFGVAVRSRETRRSPEKMGGLRSRTLHGADVLLRSLARRAVDSNAVELLEHAADPDPQRHPSVEKSVEGGQLAGQEQRLTATKYYHHRDTHTHHVVAASIHVMATMPSSWGREISQGKSHQGSR